MKPKPIITVSGTPRLQVRQLELQMAISHMRNTATFLGHTLGVANEVFKEHKIVESIRKAKDRLLECGKSGIFDLRNIDTEEDFSEAEAKILNWASEFGPFVTEIAQMDKSNIPRLEKQEVDQILNKINVGVLELTTGVFDFVEAIDGKYELTESDQTLGLPLENIYNAMVSVERFSPFMEPLKDLLNKGTPDLIALPSPTSPFAIRRVLLVILLNAVEEILDFKEKNPNPSLQIGLRLRLPESEAGLWQLELEHPTLVVRGHELYDTHRADIAIANALVKELETINRQTESLYPPAFKYFVRDDQKTTFLTMSGSPQKTARRKRLT